MLTKNFSRTHTNTPAPSWEHRNIADECSHCVSVCTVCVRPFANLRPNLHHATLDAQQRKSFFGGADAGSGAGRAQWIAQRFRDCAWHDAPTTHSTRIDLTQRMDVGKYGRQNDQRRQQLQQRQKLPRTCMSAFCVRLSTVCVRSLMLRE